MARKHLIRTRDGEHVVTEHLEDYEGCTVLQKNVPDLEHAEVIDGKLIARERQPATTLESLAAEMAELKARVGKLER